MVILRARQSDILQILTLTWPVGFEYPPSPPVWRVIELIDIGTPAERGLSASSRQVYMSIDTYFSSCLARLLELRSVMTKRVLFFDIFSFSWVLQSFADSVDLMFRLRICLLRSFGFVLVAWDLLKIVLASARLQSKICLYNLLSFVDWDLYGLLEEVPLVGFALGFRRTPNGGVYIPFGNELVGFIRSWGALVYHYRRWSLMTVGIRRSSSHTC